MCGEHGRFALMHMYSGEHGRFALIHLYSGEHGRFALMHTCTVVNMGGLL